MRQRSESETGDAERRSTYLRASGGGFHLVGNYLPDAFRVPLKVQHPETNGWLEEFEEGVSVKVSGERGP